MREKIILRYCISRDMLNHNRLTVPVDYNLNVVDNIGNLFSKNCQRQSVVILYEGNEYDAYFKAHVNSNNPDVENRYIKLFFTSMKEVLSSHKVGDEFVLYSTDKQFVFEAEFVRSK